MCYHRIANSSSLSSGLTITSWFVDRDSVLRVIRGGLPNEAEPVRSSSSAGQKMNPHFQRVAQFKAVERGKGQRCGIGLTPRISLDRICVGCVKRKQETGVSVGFHQGSSARAARTMFGRTLLPKIRRRRAE